MPHADSSSSADANTTYWPAAWLGYSVALEPPAALPTGGARGWKPLHRHRRAGASREDEFHPGWARISWAAPALFVDLVFAGPRAVNRARRLNERTHLLGDTGEIFLQCLDADRYIEIHVTPENQRLQLAWNSGALERVRRGDAALEDFTVSDLAWVDSGTRVTSTFWSARVVVPVSALFEARRELNPETQLLTAICRYDYVGGEPPVLSSTADFDGHPFHTRSAWDRLMLLPAR